MPWWIPIDNYDIQFFKVANGLLNRFVEALIWSFQRMTLLSVIMLFVLVALLALIGITYPLFCNRKKFGSRRYWKGRKDEKKLWEGK
jgi:hypothetical protein